MSQIQFSLIQVTGIIAITQTLIISIYFIHRSRLSSLNNLIFFILFFNYAVLIACSLILSSRVNTKLFLLAHIFNQTAFLIGPLVFFIIKIRLDSHFRFSKKHLVHVIPYFLGTTYLITMFYLVHIPITYRFNHIIIDSLTFLHTLVYFILTFKHLYNRGLVKKRRLNISNNINISWLPFFVYCCSVIWLIKFLFFIIWDISGYYKGCNEIINLNFLIFFLFGNIFLYFLLINPQLFVTICKYKHSGISDKDKEHYKKILEFHMTKEKLYRDSLLSLKKLAKILSIPETYLSQTINEVFNKNFYEFLNWYRIEESKRMIEQINGSSTTILSIAYEVGFNSKSTFNAAFKKHTGLTPKEYKQYRKQKTA